MDEEMGSKKRIFICVCLDMVNKPEEALEELHGKERNRVWWST